MCLALLLGNCRRLKFKAASQLMLMHSNLGHQPPPCPRMILFIARLLSIDLMLEENL